MAHQQHRVGGHAGLSGIQRLGGQDGAGGTVQPRPRQDQGGALPAELQGQRREVRRRGPGHLAPGFRAAGEDQVVPGLRREIRRNRGIALHHPGDAGAPGAGDDLLQQRGAAGRVLAGLDGHAVARRHGLQRRPEGELDRVVPGRHHPDHPLGHGLRPGQAGLEGQGGQHRAGPRPPAQPAPCPPRRLHRHQHVAQQRVLRRAPAEIGIRRRHDRLRPPRQLRRQRRQQPAPLRDPWCRPGGPQRRQHRGGGGFGGSGLGTGRLCFPDPLLKEGPLRGIVSPRDPVMSAPRGGGWFRRCTVWRPVSCPSSSRSAHRTPRD
ncbi:hypothetical protein ROTAS13_01460 [Roseomonas sp. TAS13]|nr:hypothetical protein ROTAS13_01460 [Roseomonas sp. TAS13]